MRELLQIIAFVSFFSIGLHFCVRPALSAEATKTASTGNWRLLDLDELDMEYREIRNLRDPYFPSYNTVEQTCSGTKADGTPSGECWKYGANVLFNLNLVEYKKAARLFWRNNVGMDATNRQVRRVGWHWEFGVPLGDRVEVFSRHHSQHWLDGENPDQKYPLRDEYVIKLKFFGCGK